MLKGIGDFEPEYTEHKYTEVASEIDYIDAHIDEEIKVDESGEWEFTNENSKSDGENYNKREDWFTSEIYPQLILSDMASVIENSFTLVDSIMPTEPGKYRVIMDVLLAYDVRGVQEEITDVYEEPYESGYSEDVEYNFDDVEITFLPQESHTYNAETIKIS